MDERKAARFFTRGVFGLFMIWTAAALQTGSPSPSIGAVIEEYLTFLPIDVLRAALFVGGIGLLAAPTPRPRLLFWFTTPALLYVLAGVGGALAGELLPTACGFSGAFYAAFLLLYWTNRP